MTRITIVTHGRSGNFGMRAGRNKENMKLILFVDTETSGKPKKYKAPVSDLDNWPRLVQLGWIVAYENGTPAGSGEVIIRPEGFVIPEDATAVHGISQAKAMEDGIPLHQTMIWFASIIRRCDLVVAHNVEFDANILGAEFLRTIKENPLEGKNMLCTMLAGEEFCKLPNRNGKAGYKWPKLSELYFALTGQEMGEAHTALQDTKNAAFCYFEMKSRGIIK